LPTGLYKGRGSNTVDKYLLAGKTHALVRHGALDHATQASAITFLTTTGQGYADGMRFVQMYFGPAIAMVIVAATAVPIFHRAQRLHGLRIPGSSGSTRRRAPS